MSTTGVKIVIFSITPRRKSTKFYIFKRRATPRRFNDWGHGAGEGLFLLLLGYVENGKYNK